MRAAKFKKGDEVRFVPSYRQYESVDMRWRDKIGIVLDDSDLPNVRMARQFEGWMGYEILTADQRDLVAAV